MNVGECFSVLKSFTLKKLGACKNECVGEDKFVSGGLRLPFPFNIKDDPVAPVSRSIQPSDDVTTRLGLRGRMLLSWSDFSAKWKIIQQGNSNIFSLEVNLTLYNILFEILERFEKRSGRGCTIVLR